MTPEDPLDSLNMADGPLQPQMVPRSLTAEQRAEKILVACDCDHLPHMREFVAAEMEAYASERVKQAVEEAVLGRTIEKAYEVWAAKTNAYEDAAKIAFEVHNENIKDFPIAIIIERRIRARAAELK